MKHRLINLVLFTAACNKVQPVTVPAGDAPALHRLTERQLNRSLAALFGDASLPEVDIPQDIEVHGFNNNALTRDATPYLIESIQRDMTTVTASVVAQGGDWMACAPGGGSDPTTCGRQTLETFLQRAWRRPATPEEKAWINSNFDAWNDRLGFDVALQLSLLVILQSPDFLYLIESGENGRLTSWEIASRMSFFLWDSIPDTTLYAAAADGTLTDPAVVRQQAQRMIVAPQSRDAIVEFHRQWLGFAYADEIQVDPELYFEDRLEDLFTEDQLDGIMESLKGAYMAEFELFVEHAVFGPGTLDALLTSRRGYVSDITAALYGFDYESISSEEHLIVYPRAQVGEDIYARVKAVEMPAEERAGILTQGVFLAGHSHALQPSPVLRGVFLRDRLLCVPPILPPDDVPPLEDTEEGAWTTNRERYAIHTENPACSGCHIAIDGVGFPFENYDNLGAYRITDNGAPVDASGQLVGTDVDGPVNDALDLIMSLASSRSVYDCAVTNLYRYGMHRSETDRDAAALAALQENFWNNGGVIPELLVDFVSSEAFLTLPNAGAQ
ncbi:MAG: DUF1592 domain-containing protein [Myxococcota bacterium]